MRLLISYTCEAGKMANRTYLNWTSDTGSVLTSGNQFIFSYELARLIHENREQLGTSHLEFNRALAEVQVLGGGLSPRRVSRNTKRQYMVLHQTCGALRVIRAQQYYSEGLASSEAKGLVRGLLKYPMLESAILVGIAGWQGANDPTGFLLDCRKILEHEFDGIIDTAFSWFDEPETGAFVFALALSQHENAS